MSKRVCLQSCLSVRKAYLCAVSSGYRFQPVRLQRPLGYVLHRQISRSSQLLMGPQSNSSGSKVLVHFVNQDGVRNSVAVSEGETLLDVVINKNLDISGFGACEGTLACSTCHLVFEDHVFDRLETMADEEVDMLDLAYGVAKTSRLGCQVTVEGWMDGMTVYVPQDTKDQRESAKGSK